MIKKILFAVLCALPLAAAAQLGTGQWKIHPYFVGSLATNCIDAGERVYYLASGSLYSFDKATQATTVHDQNGDLNDNNVTQIYYNYDKKYVVVTYKDSNIDIIKADGTVVNVPHIKDAVINRAKTINDVTFGDNKAYVATAFGYIALDDDTFNVVDSRNFSANITSVAVVGDIRIMSLNSQFYYCGANEQIEAAWRYKQVANANGDGRIFPVSDTRFFLTTAGKFFTVDITHGTGDDGVDTCAFTAKQVVAAVPVTVQRTPAGFVASFFSKNYYYTFDDDGNNAKRVTGNELYTTSEEGNWWVFGANGLAHIVGGVKGEYTKGNGINISNYAYWQEYDPFLKRIILCRTTDNHVLDWASSGAKTEINAYDGSTWTDITPAGAPNNQGNYWPVVSPNEPDTYYYSCRTTGGVVKVQNNAVTNVYTYANSPNGNRAVALRFDSKGNLWMANTRSLTCDATVITPENQLKAKVDSSMFVVNFMNNANYGAGFKRITFDIGAGDIKAFSNGDYGYPLVLWESNDDLSVKRYKSFNAFTDQENKDVSFTNIIFIKSDNDGQIWFGTPSGVVALNPLEAFNDDFKVNRPHLKNADGTVSSQILLDGVQVNSIAVDELNRKWIGTNTNGVYQVSPDGTEILQHFDTSNSILPSDKIYSVCCNRSTGSVMIVTATGVVEYFSDITPAEDSYDNVYAFPNPVQPLFTGLITIKGLMSNSTVVITNSAGQQVFTTTSNGGVATWDGCDAAGNRMSTGLYNVYAAQGATPATTGTPLTRIAIIK